MVLEDAGMDLCGVEGIPEAIHSLCAEIQTHIPVPDDVRTPDLQRILFVGFRCFGVLGCLFFVAFLSLLYLGTGPNIVSRCD